MQISRGYIHFDAVLSAFASSGLLMVEWQDTFLQISLLVMLLWQNLQEFLHALSYKVHDFTPLQILCRGWFQTDGFIP